MDKLVSFVKQNVIVLTALRSALANEDVAISKAASMLPAQLLRVFYQSIITMEDFHDFMKKNFEAQSTNDWPPAPPTRPPMALDVDYTHAEATPQYLMRFIGTLGWTGTQVALMLSGMATQYRKFEAEQCGVPRELSPEEMEKVRDCQVGVRRVGPFYLRHMIETNAFHGNTVVTKEGQTTTTIDGYAFFWASGTITEEAAKGLTEHVAGRKFKGKSLQVETCPGLAHAFTILLTAVEINRDVKAKYFTVDPIRGEAATPIIRGIQEGKGFYVLCNQLSIHIAHLTKLEDVLNEIQIYLLDQRGASAKFLFDQFQVARIKGKEDAAKEMKLLVNLSKKGALVKELHEMQQFLDAKEVRRNSGNRHKIFNGNASYYGDGLPEMANFAKYVALAIELKKIYGEEHFYCRSDSDAVHLHDAMKHEGVAVVNWQNQGNAFTSLATTNLEGRHVIMDTYRRIAPKKDEETGVAAPASEHPFVENIAFLADAKVASFVLPWKTDSVVNQSQAKWHLITGCLPQHYEIRFVKGGKFHTSDFYVLGTRNEEVTGKQVQNNVKRLQVMIRKTLQVAYAFEKYITAGNAYGVRLHTALGFNAIKPKMPKVVKTPAKGDAPAVMRDFDWNRDNAFRPSVGQITMIHSGVDISSQDVVVPGFGEGEEEIDEYEVDDEKTEDRSVAVVEEVVPFPPPVKIQTVTKQMYAGGSASGSTTSSVSSSSSAVPVPTLVVAPQPPAAEPAPNDEEEEVPQDDIVEFD